MHAQEGDVTGVYRDLQRIKDPGETFVQLRRSLLVCREGAGGARGMVEVRYEIR